MALNQYRINLEKIQMDEYKQVWKKFQDKINELRKRQKEVLLRIYDNLDKQKIENVRKKLQNI